MFFPMIVWFVEDFEILIVYRMGKLFNVVDIVVPVSSFIWLANLFFFVYLFCIALLLKILKNFIRISTLFSSIICKHKFYFKVFPAIFNDFC